jgi:hypothetical protein
MQAITKTKPDAGARFGAGKGRSNQQDDNDLN